MDNSDIKIKGSHNSGNILTGGDLINISVASYEKPEVNVELLVSAQRAELNNAIQTIASAYFKSFEAVKNEKGNDRSEEERKNTFASKLWKKVHAHLGVDCVKQIKRSQFHEAKVFIESLANEYNNFIASKQLVAELLTKVNQHKIFNEVVEWSFSRFGKKRFNELNHEQLIQTMTHVNQLIKELQAQKPKSLLGFIKSLFR